MDTTQWAQGIGLLKKPMEEEELLHSSLLITTTTTNNNNNSSSTATNSAIRAPILSQQAVDRKERPQKQQALHCPRCNSTNTKFCYYNNYSLTQPRYFCKTCRRYWTEGGSLRNVPVGGGSRKNKRHSSNSSNPNPNPSSSSTKIPPPPPLPPIKSCHQPFDQVQDLNLAFPNHGYGNNNNIISSGGLSAMELLRSTGITARGLGPMMPMSMPAVPESGGVLHGNGLYNFDGSMEEGSRRLLFPFGELKQEQQRGQAGEPPMFWNGMMGGGSGSW